MSSASVFLSQFHKPPTDGGDPVAAALIPGVAIVLFLITKYLVVPKIEKALSDKP